MTSVKREICARQITYTSLLSIVFTFNLKSLQNKNKNIICKMISPVLLNSKSWYGSKEE